MPRRAGALTTSVAVAAVVSLAAACTGTASGASSKSINLVAYSTPQTAYSQLIPAFNQTAGGRDISFKQSFDASGAQSRAVLAGQPADVVEFSLEPDMTNLVKGNLVPSSWNQNSYHGMITDSVVVLVVRKGNPKHIQGWDDLVKPGVQVVTPNIFSSGSARWNLMAAYGAQLKEGKSPAQALAFVQALLKNTVAQPESGSKATEAFTSGTGDVLLSYENEAIKAQQSGADVQYITPPQTILIENPIAVTTQGEKSPAAKAFVNYLYTDAAQKIFAKNGYRPVVAADLDKKQFPTPKQLFTINDLGGWDKVMTQFFDPTNGSISKIETGLGVSGG